MRRIFLIVAMLLPTTSALAGATIWVDQNQGNELINGTPHKILQVRYSTDVNVRAFALNLVVDNGMNLDLIRDFNRGESAGAGKGYGIFPGRFRDVINPASPNWADVNYHPGTPWNSPGAMGATLDSNWVVVELGTLYKGDANKPPTSGMLFRIDVNSEGGPDCNLTITQESMRGGVVGDNGAAVATFIYSPVKVSFCPGVSAPATLTYPAADYNGFYPVSWSAVAEASTYLLDRSTNGGGTWASIYSGANTSFNEASLAIGLYRYRVKAIGCAESAYNTGATDCNVQVVLAPAWFKYPIYDPDCNIPILWSASAEANNYELEYSTNAGGAWTPKYSGNALSYGHMAVAANTKYRYRVRASNIQFGIGAWNTGSWDCNAILSTCYPHDSNEPNWKANGRPDCWCKASAANEPNGSGYQCDGDADGTVYGNFRIYTGDVALVATHYSKKAAALTADPNAYLQGKLKIEAACADIDHKYYGGSAASGLRVYTADIGTISTNYKKKNSSAVTATDRLPGNCPR